MACWPATAEHLLARGEPACCVMQLLMDYTATFYGWWHDELSEQNPQQGGEKKLTRLVGVFTRRRLAPRT